MTLANDLTESFTIAQTTLNSFVEDKANIEKVAEFSQLIVDSLNSNGKPLICGNGGSTCDAMHFAEELTGRFRKNRKALPAIHLGDSSHITCVGNDFGFDEIFARGVEAFGKAGDVFIGMSTSGNSENVSRAVNKAKEQGLKTVLLLGKDGGKLKGVGDLEFIITGQTADRIQEIHMMILHIAIEGMERLLFPDLY
jgi:D-sedoheptulose 7-phosphate isomerase